jgi:hypothetical protein
VALVHEVIPLIDAITNVLGKFISKTDQHPAIRHAANTALAVLNKYYSLTDDSIVYRIAMLLHPRYKTFYFRDRKWKESWINEALKLLRNEWTENYKPQQPEPLPTPATQAATTRSRSGSKPTRPKISFDVVINYGRTSTNIPDVLEQYLAAPPLPYENDPIGFWNKQRAAGVTSDSPELAALGQMGLDYLSAPATSVDPERLFSFSGGTISKLRNQLTDDSAHATVMIGQWADDSDLIADTEFEQKLVKGWTRKKRKAPAPPDDDRHSKIIVVDESEEEGQE